MTPPIATPAAPALEARGVEKRYGDTVALGGVSLRVEPGERIAIVGESGSGKSTLLRLFNRGLEPDAGAVFAAGRPVTELDAVALRRRTGYVPQNGGLLPHWTVLRNAGTVPWLVGHEDVEDRARRALDAVGLAAAEFGPRYPFQLSGGQRQRVAIARAVAAEPEVLLLDEPFGALDAITRGEIQDWFAAFASRLSAAAVLVTHDIGEALRIGDRVAVLRDGLLEQIASPSTLCAAPATSYVRTLLERAGAPLESPE